MFEKVAIGVIHRKHHGHQPKEVFFMMSQHRQAVYKLIFIFGQTGQPRSFLRDIVIKIKNDGVQRIWRKIFVHCVQFYYPGIDVGDLFLGKLSGLLERSVFQDHSYCRDAQAEDLFI